MQEELLSSVVVVGGGVAKDCCIKVKEVLGQSMNRDGLQVIK